MVAKGRRQLFRDGLRRELKRCKELDLAVKGPELLNRLAFPCISFVASRSEYIPTVAPEAASLITQIYYCLDRFHRYVDMETPLVSQSYSSDPQARRAAEDQLEMLRNAAAAELEASLSTYASVADSALNALLGTSRFWRWIGRLTN